MRFLRTVSAYLALAVGLLWPSAWDPVAATPGAPRTDLWDSLWSFWFFAHQVFAGASPVRVDGLLNPPHGGSLWVADPLNALVATPLLPLLGPAVTWTLLVHLHLVFAGVVAHHLGEAVAEGAGAQAPHGRGAGWIAGVGVMSAPMLLSQVHNGASEAVGLGWVVLAVLAVWRLWEAPTRRRAVAAGVALGVGTVAHWYGGLEGWIFFGCAGLAFAGQALRSAQAAPGERGRGATAWLLAAAVGIGIAGPVAYEARTITTAKDSVVGIKQDHEIATLRRTIGPADPVGFVMPGDYRSPDFAEVSRYAERYVHCNYLGWTLLIGAAASMLRPRGSDRRSTASPVRPRPPMALLWAAALVAATLACGPVLARFGGPVLLPGRLGVPLPYLLLERLPGFSGLSLLYRLAWLAVVCLAALAARGLSGRAWPAVVAALLLETRLVSPAADLPEHTDCRLSPALQALADAPEGAVMNWPVEGGRPYLYEQTVHHHEVAATLNFPNTPVSMGVWKVALGSLGESDADYRTHVAARAKASGVRYLVLHDDPSAEPDTHDAAARRIAATFPALASEGGVTVIPLW